MPMPMPERCRQCGASLDDKSDTYIGVKSRGDLPYYTHKFCNLDHMWIYYAGIVSDATYQEVRGYHVR